MGPSRLIDLPVQRFRALEQRIRGAVIRMHRAVLESDRGLDAQRVGFYLGHPSSRRQSECFVQTSRDCLVVLIAFPIDARQAHQCRRPPHRLVTRFVHGALRVAARLLGIAGRQGQLCQEVQARVETRFVVLAACHSVLEQPQLVGQRAVGLPVRPQGHGEIERIRGFRIFHRRDERLLQIWKLPLDDRAVGDGGFARDLQEIGAMARPKVAGAGIEPFLGEFAQRFKHGEAHNAGFVRAGAKQRSRHQRLELPSRVPGFANRFNGGSRPAATKHRQRRKEPLLRLAQ